jgi:hypothetical protein
MQLVWFLAHFSITFPIVNQPPNLTIPYLKQTHLISQWGGGLSQLLMDWPVMYKTPSLMGWPTGNKSIVDWPAGHVLISMVHCRWTGWTCVVPIVDQLASLVLSTLYKSWPEWCCPHCGLTGQSGIVSIQHYTDLLLASQLDNCTHCELTGQNPLLINYDCNLKLGFHSTVRN